MGPFDDLTAAQRQQIRDAHAAKKTARAGARGDCPVCGRNSRLTKAGKVWTHGADTGVWPPMNCLGSGQSPKEG